MGICVSVNNTSCLPGVFQMPRFNSNGSDITSPWWGFSISVILVIDFQSNTPNPLLSIPEVTMSSQSIGVVFLFEHLSLFRVLHWAPLYTICITSVQQYDFPPPICESSKDIFRVVDLSLKEFEALSAAYNLTNDKHFCKISGISYYIPMCPLWPHAHSLDNVGSHGCGPTI